MVVWLALCTLALGCSGPPQAELEGRRFVRCAQRDPPQIEAQVGGLALRLEARVLTVRGVATQRVVAFAGPVSARLPEAQVAQLEAARPALILYAGGLGDDLDTARHNLARLAAIDALTLFLPGGTDRAPILDGAFAAREGAARARVLDASGLRALVLEGLLGGARFGVIAGAPLGHYARTDDACGAGPEDLAEVRAALAAPGPTPQLWSWHAPVGYGVATGAGGSELGSPALAALAREVGARGGVFAYPEGRAGEPASAEGAMVVRRLGGSGVRRTDGSFAGPGFSLLAPAPTGALGQP